MTSASADYKPLNFYEKTFGMWATHWKDEMSALIVRWMKTECGIRVYGAIMGIKWKYKTKNKDVRLLVRWLFFQL